MNRKDQDNTIFAEFAGRTSVVDKFNFDKPHKKLSRLLSSISSRYMLCRLFFCGFVVAIISQQHTVFAQTAGAGSDADPGSGTSSQTQSARTRQSNRLMEEVVVTAQKREDRAQDIPIAIQAFGSQALDALNIGNTDELGPLIPSLTFTKAAGYTLIYLRGVGTSQFVPSADPSIATYVDGIYLPTGQAGTTSLGAVKRVEVLKGPQGTLFGRNSIGGAINVITEKPRDEVYSAVKLQYTDLNHRSASGSISTPVTDWFSLGLAAGYSRDVSVVETTNVPTPIARTKTQRVQLSFFPTDNITLDLTSYRSEQENVNLSIGQNSKPSGIGRDLYNLESEGDDYQVDNDYVAQSYSEQKLDYAELAWVLPWLDVKLLASKQEVNIPVYDYDFDGTDQPIAAFDTRGGEFEGLDGEYSHIETAELQFISNVDSWRSEVFEWVAGLYYYHGEGAFDPARFSAQLGLFTSAAGVPPEVVGLATDVLGIESVMLYLSGILETDSESAYFQGTYTVLPWLDITLGGRYQRENRFLTKSETNYKNPQTGQLENLFQFPLKGEKESNFAPKAQITTRPFEDVMVYLSYGEGYKSGTYNIVAIYEEPDYIVPEQVVSYELGAKTEFFDGNLRLNGAVFKNKITDLQDGFVSLLSGGAVSFNTAPAAETKGFEFDLQWVPMPSLNPGLVITANGAYVEAVYTDFPNGEGFEEESGYYNGDLDLTGFNLRNTPKRSGGLGVIQTIPFDFGSLELAVDASHRSRTFYNANNTVSEDPYTLVNARASFEYVPWRTRITVFGQNITDKRYHTQQFETDFGLLTTLAAPKSIGVRLQWEY